MPFGLPKETIEQICCVLKNHPQVETVLLYGSRAKGNYKNGSDIDLTFKGEDLNLSILNRIDNELDDLLLPWMFDLSIYSNIKTPDLIDHIDRVGIQIYQRNHNSVNSNPPLEKE